MSATMAAEAQLWLLHDSSAPGNLVTVTEPHGRWFMWFAEDSPLEEDGFEPSVPLVSRGAIRREFPKRGARLAASWGVELRRRSSIWEFDPTSRDQTRGILLRHLDDAIQADGDMPV